MRHAIEPFLPSPEPRGGRRLSTRRAGGQCRDRIRMHRQRLAGRGPAPGAAFLEGGEAPETREQKQGVRAAAGVRNWSCRVLPLCQHPNGHAAHGVVRGELLCRCRRCCRTPARPPSTAHNGPSSRKGLVASTRLHAIDPARPLDRARGTRPVGHDADHLFAV